MAPQAVCAGRHRQIRARRVQWNATFQLPRGGALTVLPDPGPKRVPLPPTHCPPWHSVVAPGHVGASGAGHARSGMRRGPGGARDRHGHVHPGGGWGRPARVGGRAAELAGGGRGDRRRRRPRRRGDGGVRPDFRRRRRRDHAGHRADGRGRSGPGPRAAGRQGWIADRRGESDGRRSEPGHHVRGAGRVGNRRRQRAR